MSNETENLYRTYQQGLDDIKASITSTTTDQIDTRQAEKAGIKQHRISLNQDENRPQYFIPFDQIIPLSDLNYPTFQADSNFYARSLHGYIKNLFTEVYQDEYPVQPGICYVPWGDLPVEELLEIDRYWSVSLTASATGRPRRPHIKCLMSDDIFEGDDRLNRGEIITMIHLIKARLEPPYTTEPVLIFSVMYPHHLRVLEASYNGENLVVGKTPLYDMATYDYALLVSLAKWWLGYPVLGTP